MRVKAFSLIEIIVVIVLIGIIFSLVLNVYTSKINTNLNLLIKDISLKVNDDATLYIYGNNCKKAIIELADSFYVGSSNFGYIKENVVIKKDSLGSFEEVNFDRYEIEGKRENICFKLGFKNRKFFQKLILSTQNGYYLFSPFYQSIKKFDSFEDAKDSFENNSLYPKSIDGYYHE
jgi:prepilin-type N-terminal cleavage/methylation domain-containing protein